jgi:hypothetical protein
MKPEHIPSQRLCQCVQCRAERSRRLGLEAVAARMREYNLTHGKGCATRRKAIEAREKLSGSRRQISLGGVECGGDREGERGK